MKYKYIPSKVCSQEIILDMDGDIVKDVQFIGGCNGNLQGISQLAKGMSYRQLKEKLSGIHCGFKDTSCPDQLIHAIEAAMQDAEK